MKRAFRSDGGVLVDVTAQASAARIGVTWSAPAGTGAADVSARRAPNGDWLIESGGITRPCVASSNRGGLWLTAAATLRFRAVDAKRSGAGHDDGVRSPMTGKVVAVHVQVGDTVGKNQPLLVVEAMKMEHVLRAPRAGQVIRVACAAGEQIEGGAELVELTAVQPHPTEV